MQAGKSLEDILYCPCCLCSFIGVFILTLMSFIKVNLNRRFVTSSKARVGLLSSDALNDESSETQALELMVSGATIFFCQ